MARRRVMVEQIKDTIRSVDHITTPLAGKTKVTASTTAQYVEEKSAQAKNLHYETGGKEYNGKSITSKKNQLMRQNVIFFFICKDKYIYIYIY